MKKLPPDTGNSKKRTTKPPIQPIRKKDLLFKILGKARAVYLDLKKAVLIDTVSVNANLREKLGDLVLKIPFRSGNGNLVAGLEQQTQGRFPPERALSYQVRFLRAARKADPEAKVTAVCTIVIFSNHMPSSQNSELFAGLNMEEKRMAQSALGNIIPLELAKIADGKLRRQGLAGILLLLLKHRRGEPMLPLLETLWGELRACKEEEEGRECVEAVVNFALLAAPEKERDAIIKQVGEQLGPHEEELGMTVATALIREGKLVGKREGIREGKLAGKREGIREGKLETARNMLRKGMPVATICELTGLSASSLRLLGKKIKV